MNDRKRIILIIATIIVGIFSGYKFYEQNQDKTENEIVNSAVEEVKEDIEEIKAIENADYFDEKYDEITVEENQSTTEIPELSEDDEKALEEQEVEDEAFELQGNIAYEGDRAKSWNVELGDYVGLTYYSQIDSRWKNIPYTSIGDSSQTIGSSACGPTSAAMIVSSIKGTITPVTMSELFVENGYRSANNGTYWSAYRAVADEFNIGYTETADIQKAIELLRNNHYLICSVGNGLFTTGGHYIVIYGIDGEILKIYDPYLYSGKFETSTRRGKVTVSGNTIYCSVDNFENYANYKQFFCYEYEPKEVDTNNSTDNQVSTSTYARYVKVNSHLNIRTAPGTNNPIVGYLNNGDRVIINENYSNWSRIDSGWICSDYLVSYNPISSNFNDTVGNFYRLKYKTSLFSNSNLTGTKYSYLENTKIKVLSNINSNVDYIQVIATGRRAYIDNSAYSNNVVVAKNATTTVGNYYRLKSRCNLYSKSNLTGTKYTYLANTRVKVIKNVTASIDYVYIPVTGRYAYIKNKNY